MAQDNGQVDVNKPRRMTQAAYAKQNSTMPFAATRGWGTVVETGGNAKGTPSGHPRGLATSAHLLLAYRDGQCDSDVQIGRRWLQTAVSVGF